MVESYRALRSLVLATRPLTIFSQVAEIDGVEMSSQLASKIKNNGAGHAVLKQQLLGTRQLVQRHAHTHIFRFMDLPQELREDILLLSMVTGARVHASSGHRYVRVSPEKAVETHPRDPRYLPHTAFAGNRLLRVESILVALQQKQVRIDSPSNCLDFKKWLSGIDFEPARRAGVTGHKTGFDAVKSLEFVAIRDQFTPKRLRHREVNELGEWELLEKCSNLRSLTVDVDNWECRFLLLLNDEPNISRIHPRHRRVRFHLHDLTKLNKLADLHFKFVGPNMFDNKEIVDERFKSLVTWLEERFERKRVKVKVTAEYEV